MDDKRSKACYLHKVVPRSLRKICWHNSHLLLIFALCVIIFYALKIWRSVLNDEQQIGPDFNFPSNKNGSKNFGKSDTIYYSKLGDQFTIMTFNTWNSGRNVKNGLEKIAKIINEQNPDIVGLQEMYETQIDSVIKMLKFKWEKCWKRNGNNFILTRWSVIEQYALYSKFYHQGCKIGMQTVDSSFFVNVWNIHLPFQYLGFERACSSNNSDDFYEGEYTGKGRLLSRFQSVTNLFANLSFKKNVNDSSDEPTIVLGDFNSASHLDWIEDTKHLHCNWSITWPVTKLFEKMKFIDSYREVHTDPMEDAGHTLMYIAKYNEVPDRIDYIYYIGDKVKPVKSFTIGSSHLINGSNWPSDHRALITIFNRLPSY